MRSGEHGYEVTASGDLVHFRLDGTKANALGAERYAALTEVAASLRPDQVLLLSSAGANFSAGQDLREFAAAQAAGTVAELLRQGTDAVLSVLESPATVVAAVRGAAVGGGALLAAAADVVLMADDSRIRLPELELGMPLGASVLERLVGGPASRRLMLTGAWATAAEVASYGGAQVVASSELDRAATDTCEALLAADRGARAAARDLFGDGERAAAALGYRAEVAATIERLG
ncbi:enoyl-CoA hydratase-related protein [Nocardioides gilvus]|uniref:enoyl-CoA hydratase-related protein n=1 Tax=Nocardioides gilvus TaxID=1735589 RepID=UPI000D748CE5|nr:enoyl-CoA hydratase-related protein [Nocardioides gilvus]